MEKPKIILIGCGGHSVENLIPSLVAISNVEVSTICDIHDRSLSKANLWFPKAKKVNKQTYDYSDLKGHSAVVVVGPPQLHNQVSRMSIELGIPIFVEKPPTINTEELNELVNLASDNRVITCVGHNLRHSDAAIEFQNIVQKKEFGKPVAMEMRYMASKPRGVRWGLKSPIRSFLLSHANHAIDLMIYQMGKIENTVAARVWPDVEGGVAITVQFIFESGAVGNLLASSYAPYFDVNVSVLSDTGCIAQMNGLRDVNVTGKKALKKRWHLQWKPRTLETGYKFSGYQRELEIFLKAVSSPQMFSSKVHPTFADELEIYKAMDAIEKSIETNFNMTQ